MKRAFLFFSCLLCTSVLMAQERFWVDSLMYEVTSTNPSEVMVYSAKSDISQANIPATVTNNSTTYNVTSIGTEALAYCSNLTLVTFEENSNIKSIGDRAFVLSDKLTSIEIPEGVETIGFQAFMYCYALTNVILPNSVSSIGHSAFYKCTSLSSVNIPENISLLELQLFFHCTAMTEINIPNSVTKIDDSAFGECSGLTSITIPENVNTIANNAFYKCTNLTLINSRAINPPTIGGNVFLNTPSEKRLIVPCGSLTAYANSNWNNYFTNIEEDCEAGIEDAEALKLTSYPNPTNSKVRFNQTIETIDIIDLTGKKIKSFYNVNEIDIEHLPSGVYYLKLFFNDNVVTRKIIKK